LFACALAATTTTNFAAGREFWRLDAAKPLATEARRDNGIAILREQQLRR
jgi:hypothetical protein